MYTGLQKVDGKASVAEEVLCVNKMKRLRKIVINGVLPDDRLIDLFAVKEMDFAQRSSDPFASQFWRIQRTHSKFTFMPF